MLSCISIRAGNLLEKGEGMKEFIAFIVMMAICLPVYAQEADGTVMYASYMLSEAPLSYYAVLNPGIIRETKPQKPLEPMSLMLLGAGLLCFARLFARSKIKR